MYEKVYIGLSIWVWSQFNYVYWVISVFNVVPGDITVHICRGRSGPDLGFSDQLADLYLIGKWDIGKCRDSARR